jgi:hypothetical protein
MIAAAQQKRQFSADHTVLPILATGKVSGHLEFSVFGIASRPLGQARRTVFTIGYV